MRGAANNFSVQFNMKYCSVSGCDNNTGKSGISFFSFPKENRLKEEWVKFINRREICSAHFSPHCITANNHLRSGSVPTQDPEHQAIQLEHDYAQSNNCKEEKMLWQQFRLRPALWSMKLSQACSKNWTTTSVLLGDIEI